ncbi:MAG TPA: hypothetical protein VE596_05150 [Gaiellaceae bacterium]|nr:hypothetical protein [Gaiellaceae bacterium]
MERDVSVRRAIVVVSVAAVAGVAVAGSDLWSARSASGRPESSVQPLRSAPVPAVFKSGIAASAKTTDASTDDLLEVAAAGDGGGRAGLVLGHTPAGDVISLFTPFNFTSFSTPRRLLRGQAIAAYASIRAASDGSTGRVYVSGVAAPVVRRAALDVVDGSTIDVQLVTAGRGGFAYFTYATDQRSAFPRVLHAYDAGGTEIGQEDLQADIAPPTAG